MSTTTLILPGIGNSDLGHWQSLWQASHPDFVRVQQRDWDHPVLAEWVTALEQAVARADGEVVLVAHSLGCLLVAHWAAQTMRRVKGALLVAPPSPTSVIFPKEASGFYPFPVNTLRFSSIVVASSDDLYGDSMFSRSCAEAWGSRYVNIGRAGHINTQSGFGDWQAGFAFYLQLAGRPDAQAVSASFPG